MAQTIKLKRSNTSGAVPTTSQLELGEVAINTYDGKMYIKKNDGSDSVVEVGASGSNADTVDNLHASQFVRSDADDEKTGHLKLRNNAWLWTQYSSAHDEVRINANTSGGLDVYNQTDSAFANIQAGSFQISGTGTITGTTFNNWNTAYGWGNHASAGYITGNQTITLTGDVSGSGTTSISVTIADDSHNHVISNVDGLQSALDAKLASSSYTASDVLTKIKTVDGAGSGLDADTVDGVQVSNLAQTNLSSETFDGGTSTTINIKCDDGGMAMLRANGNSQGTGALEVGQSDTYGGGISYNGDGSPSFVSGESSDHITFYRLENGNRTEVFHYPYNSNTVNFNSTPTVGSSNVWHSGNDGSGSGLDADLLDGQHASAFQPAGTYNTVIGTDSDINTSGSTIIDNIYVTDGVITSMGTRSLTLSDLGYTGETNATADQTPSEILTAIKTVDGSGSGLDADLLDGVQGSSYLRSDTGDTFDGHLKVTGAGSYASGVDTVSNGSLVLTQGKYIYSECQNNYLRLLIGHTTGGNIQIGQSGTALINGIALYTGTSGNNTLTLNGNKIWNAGNDGSGSGLDADTCDGQHLGTSASVQFGSVLSTGNVTAYSDRRIKENITPITEALSKVQKLTGNTYTRNDQEDTVTRYAGLIAQEVEEVLPEAVREAEDGIKALDYNATTALLVESIKELKAEVDDLKIQLEKK